MKPSFDVAKIAVYIIAICSVLTVGALNTILKPWGLNDAEITTISLRIGSIGSAAVLVMMVINAIKNPTPPPGTTSAVIPQGSVPVVAPAPGGGAPTVAVVSPSSVTAVTPASTAPPKP